MRLWIIWLVLTLNTNNLGTSIGCINRNVALTENVMSQKGYLGGNAFFLLFHFCIEKCSYATSGAGTACHSGAPESTPELRISSLVFYEMFC
jgi:hypothetical protein